MIVLDIFKIIHQSEDVKSTISKTLWRCIASRPQAVMYSKSVCFPSSPVVTVGLGGLYKCTITHGTVLVSNLIWVSMRLREFVAQVSGKGA